MSNLRSMNIATRSFTCFGIIAVILIGLGLFSLKQMANIQREGEQVECVRFQVF